MSCCNNKEPAVLGVKLIHPLAKMPYQATPGSGCYDVYAVDDGGMSDNRQLIKYDTHIILDIPEDYDVLLFPRSSIIKKNMMLANSVGYIDSDYRNNLLVVFRLFPGFIRYKAGDRIAQITLRKKNPCNMVEVQVVSETERGEGGWGSTGK